jgi:uncharacterized protein (TIGR02646 family)
MKYITKGNPPIFTKDCVAKLQHKYSGKAPLNHREYANMIGAAYEDYPCKDEWSKTLLEEQGYLCAYTMVSIEKTGLGFMKREHINPQNDTPQNDLNHRNVVAVCMGNEGYEPKDQYADTRKGDTLLNFITPLSPDCEKLIKYRPNGEITSPYPNVLKEIVDDLSVKPRHHSVLHLNHQDLIKARCAAWEIVKRELTKLAKGGDWRRNDIEDFIERYKNRNHQKKFYEFCNFVLYRLEKELKIRPKK